MNIYLRELKSNIRSFLVWSAVLIFLIAAGMMKYEAFAATGEELNRFFEALPSGLLEVMGIRPDQDLTALTVYYSVFFLYFALLLATHAALLGASVLSREERDRTADFLLTRPRSRGAIVTAKVAASVTEILLLNWLTWGASVAFVEPFNRSAEPLWPRILVMCLSLLLQQLVFFALGLLISVLVRRPALASSLAGAAVLTAFLIKALADLNDDLEWLGTLSPFRWFNALDILNRADNAWPAGYLAAGLLAVLMAIGLTYVLYGRRDISI